MDAGIHVCPFAAGLTMQHNYRYPTNNLNQLFTSTVILRPACDCCWQIGEQRRTGNERTHLLTLKITNWKVLGPGVNSTWLLQMTEWEFSKERTYLKEFSKIRFWCHGKTLIQNNSIDCWTCPQEGRYLLSKNCNVNIVIQNHYHVHALSISENKRERKHKKKGSFYCVPTKCQAHY